MLLGTTFILIDAISLKLFYNHPLFEEEHVDFEWETSIVDSSAESGGVILFHCSIYDSSSVAVEEFRPYFYELFRIAMGHA